MSDEQLGTLFPIGSTSLEKVQRLKKSVWYILFEKVSNILYKISLAYIFQPSKPAVIYSLIQNHRVDGSSEMLLKKASERVSSTLEFHNNPKQPPLLQGVIVERPNLIFEHKYVNTALSCSINTVCFKHPVLYLQQSVLGDPARSVHNNFLVSTAVWYCTA